MRTEMKRDRGDTPKPPNGRGRRKPTVEQLDAYYRGQPEAIRLACLRLLRDVLKGGAK